MNIVKDKKLINSVLPKDVLTKLGVERIVDEKLTDSLVEEVENSFPSSILAYMTDNGYDLDEVLRKTENKYKSYILNSSKRINGSILSEQNISNEAAADFLAELFNDTKNDTKTCRKQHGPYDRVNRAGKNITE